MSSNINKQGIINTSGNINPNIIPNSYIMPRTSPADPSTGSWITAGSNTMTRSRVLIANGMYGFQNEGIQTPDDGSCYGIDRFPLDGSTDYVISMYARIVDGTEGYAGFNVYASTVNDGSHIRFEKKYYITPLTKEWTRCWMQFTTDTNTTRNVYIGIVTGETSVTTQMCLVKIERGTILTPWCPKSGDDIYVGTTLGFNEFISNPISSIANNYVNANHFYEL